MKRKMEIHTEWKECGTIQDIKRTLNKSHLEKYLFIQRNRNKHKIINDASKIQTIKFIVFLSNDIRSNGHHNAPICQMQGRSPIINSLGLRHIQYGAYTIWRRDDRDNRDINIHFGIEIVKRFSSNILVAINSTKIAPNTKYLDSEKLDREKYL